MPKFKAKKRPAIEAIQFIGTNIDEVEALGDKGPKAYVNADPKGGTALTKHGSVTFKVGDFLIVGEGEVCPCTQDEFEKRYEPGE